MNPSHILQNYYWFFNFFFLDSEWSEKCIGFRTMRVIYSMFCVCVHDFDQNRSAQIFNIKVEFLVSSSKLDKIIAFERLFFEIFLILKNNMKKTDKKLRKTLENLRHNDFVCFFVIQKEWTVENWNFHQYHL